MIRLIFKIPTDFTPESLTPEQQTAIYSVFGQYILPIPGTIAVDNYHVGDAVVSDSFYINKISELELPMEILCLAKWNGRPEYGLEIEIPLNESFLTYLPDINIYDSEGNILTTEKHELVVPHNWSGWPNLT